MRRSLSTFANFTLYIVLLTAAACKIASMPVYSFDGYMYSYMASSDVHGFKGTPGLPDYYAHLGNDVYAQQAPYYAVKPLFIAAVRAAAHFTSVLWSPYLVGASCYFALGCGVWFWLGALGVKGPWQTLAAVLIMFSSVITDTAREGTPDIMCAALTLIGASVLLSSKTPLVGEVILASAIFVRPDAVILNGLLMAAAWSTKKISFSGMCIVGVGLIGCYFAASRGGYPYGQVLHWGLRTSYANALLHNLMKTELAVYAPFALLGMFAFRAQFQRRVLVAVLASMVVRYLAMPVFVVRYLVPAGVIVAVLGAASVLRGRSGDRVTDEAVQSPRAAAAG